MAILQFTALLVDKQQNKTRLRHVIIVPAYNEAENIGRLIKSIIDQTRRPDLLVIVDDGSSDNTAEIVLSYAKATPWVTLVRKKEKGKHQPGGKVIQAFNAGLNTIQLEQFDLISKFDADLAFEPDYLERIQEAFVSDAYLGLVGGICQIRQKDRWVYENLSDKTHVRGPIKTYSTECFRQIGGLTPILGWDTIDTFKIMYFGFSIKVIQELRVKHYRKTSEISNHEFSHNLAFSFINLGYHPIFVLTSIVKRSWREKSLNVLLSTPLKYLQLKLRGFKTPLSKTQVSFINSYMRNKMISKITSKFKHRFF